MTPFVGRRHEVAKLRTELQAERNVILTGSYGIGRTTLLNEVARLMAAEWRFLFLDFAQTGGQLCRDLFGALFPRCDVPKGGTGLTYKWARYRVATRPPEDRRGHVLVLDDVARLSAAKLDLVRCLVRASRFRLVAVAEDFMPATELTRLRAALLAGEPLRIGPLSLRDAERFFEECAKAFELPWSRAEIHGLALAARGVPLGMQQLLTNELERRGPRLGPRRKNYDRETGKERTP